MKQKIKQALRLINIDNQNVFENKQPGDPKRPAKTGKTAIKTT